MRSRTSVVLGLLLLTVLLLWSHLAPHLAPSPPPDAAIVLPRAGLEELQGGERDWHLPLNRTIEKLDAYGCIPGITGACDLTPGATINAELGIFHVPYRAAGCVASECDTPDEYTALCLDGTRPAGSNLCLCTATGWVCQTGSAAIPCGNGIIDAGEQCDVGNIPTGCTCTNCQCTFQVCGNGMQEGAEACDPPGQLGVGAGGSGLCAANFHCAADCLSCVPNGTCGDAMVGVGETCDPPFEGAASGCGSADGLQDLCNADCTLCTDCGDGVLDAGEECDPGDRYSASPDGTPAPNEENCRTLCRPDCNCPNPVCGNGVFESGEGCDVSDDASPCQGTVTINGLTQPRCTGQCLCIPTCHDGVIETGTGSTTTDEQCDFTGATGGGGTTTFGNAVAFNGTAGIINTNISTGAQFGTNDAILELFFTPAAFSGTQRILYRAGIGATNGFTLSLLSSAQLRFDTSDGTQVSVTTASNTPLVANTQYHAVITRRGADGHINIWLMNRTAGETTHTNAASATGAPGSIGGSTALRFGGNPTPSERYNGTLDEVRLRIVPQGTVLTFEASSNLNSDWQLPACSGTVTDTDFCWQMDETGTGSIVEGKNSTSSTDSEAGWTRVSPSPYTAPSSGGSSGGTEFGCTAPQFCNPDTCRCQDPETSNGRTFYVATTGTDAAGRGTSAAPYRTVAYAVNPARFAAGDTVVLKDTTPGGTGHTPFKYLCGSVNPQLNGNVCNGTGANAPCGTAQSPITIQAENERQAEINSDGSDPAIEIGGCQYVKLVGLTATSQDNTAFTQSDNSTIFIHDSRQITVRRNLGFRNNRCGNNMIYQFIAVTDSLAEENECWENSRHCMQWFGSDGNEARRNYFNNNGRTESGACVPQGGTSREQLSNYPSSNGIWENNLATGSQGWGYNWEAGGGSWQGERPTSNNLAVGNIAAGTYLAMKIFTRDGTDPLSARRAIDSNTVRDFLAARTTGSFGLRHSVATRTILQRLSIYANALGLTFDEGGATGSPHLSAQASCSEIVVGPPGPPPQSSWQVLDSIITGNTGTDLTVNACGGSATADCTLTNNQADSAGGTIGGIGNFTGNCSGNDGIGDDCACSGNTNTAPTNFGDSGAGNCLVLGSGGRGAVIRCKTEGGTTLTGTANRLWANNTEDDGAATCAAQTTSGPVTPCLGGFRFCGAVRAPYNNASDQCKTFAALHLNHTLSAGSGTGCFAGSDSEEVGCP